MMSNPSSNLLNPIIEQYCIDHTAPESPILSKLSRATHLRTHVPQMLSGHLQGAFLQMMSKMIRPTYILELGTFTGYSAICLAQGLQPGGKLVTIDSNPEMLDFAMPFFEEAGLKGHITMIIGDASEEVPKLGATFDLVFIDADKENYIKYFNLILPKVKPNGYIIADNVLWYGKVISDTASFDSETTEIVKFNNYIQNHPDVENILLPIRDGLMVMKKKS